jgi:MraZ protein
MFLGQRPLFLENDFAFVIPEEYRGLFAAGAFITRGFEQNLLVMSEKVFQDLTKQVGALNIANPQARLLIRMILGNASRLELSESGKVLIPEDLKKFAGLEEKIILVGQGNFCEIWAPLNWKKQTEALLDTMANSEGFAQLELVLQ